jgi:anti-sigma factor ChrR (cupin superfamily)
MLINADLAQRVVIDTGTLFWTPSPIAGIERKMLERDGGEVARATSLVRFGPDTAYAPHVHIAGEEILVLDGVFSDEYADYPAGTYIRNPPGSRHRPFSRTGCLLLVKLHQMSEDDRARVVIDTNRVEWGGYPGAPELLTASLHAYGPENVRLLRWRSGLALPQHGHPGGEEFYILSGALSDEYGTYPAGTWVRNPVGSGHTPFSEEGARLLVKTGHLSVSKEGEA